ncbi:MAG: ribonuclease III [Firmicutes bacterium]|nr:ribonuclease III [Bacillota bacterium]
MNEEPGSNTLSRLQTILGVCFQDQRLLKKAVTHSSFEGGGPAAGNERLEFLGDAVLKLVCAWYFYEKHPILSEGELSVMIGRIVSEKSLASAATRIGLHEFLIVSQSLEMTGGRGLPSVLADAFEAITGAIFLEHGLDVVRNFTIEKLQLDSIDIEEFLRETNLKNYKAKLQEFLQKRGKDLPEYKTTSEDGPDHDKIFSVSVYSEKTAIGCGTGKTKKEAEQAAAENALKSIGCDWVFDIAGKF